MAMKTFIKFILIASIAIGYVLLCSSCGIKKRFLDNNCRKDTITQIVHDTVLVSLPQDTGKFLLQIDYLKQKIALLEGDSSNPEPPNRTIYEDSLIKVNARLNKETKQLEWNLVHKKPLIKEVPIKVEVKTPVVCPPCPQEDLTYKQWFDRQSILTQAFHMVVMLFALMFLATIILNRFHRWRSN
jgi:hypothetical protein